MSWNKCLKFSNIKFYGFRTIPKVSPFHQRLGGESFRSFCPSIHSSSRSLALLDLRKLHLRVLRRAANGASQKVCPGSSEKLNRQVTSVPAFFSSGRTQGQGIHLLPPLGGSLYKSCDWHETEHVRHFPGNRKSNESPNTPWDCHHICRSIGMVLGGQWGGIYGSPMERLESDKWSKNQKKNIIIPSGPPRTSDPGKAKIRKGGPPKKGASHGPNMESSVESN